MESNEATGSLTDVQNARRAAKATAAPWWMRALTVALVAALLALFYGGPHQVWTYPVVLICAVAAIIAIRRWQQHRGIRSRKNRKDYSRAYWVTLSATVLIGVVTASVLRVILPPGTAEAYMLQFCCAALVFGAGLVLLARVDASPKGQRS